MAGHWDALLFYCAFDAAVITNPFNGYHPLSIETKRRAVTRKSTISAPFPAWVLPELYARHRWSPGKVSPFHLADVIELEAVLDLCRVDMVVHPYF